MNIGDITGRIVIQDSGSLTVGQFASKISSVGKSIQSSMSLATLATETAVRQINAKLATLKTQIKPTEAAKGTVSDLESLIKKRQEEIAALKGGQAAIDALNRKRLDESQALRIAKAQVDAGVGAESDLGKEIAKNTRLLDRYEQELDQVARSQAASVKRVEDQVAAFQKLSDVGSKLTARVTLPLIGLAAVSFKTSTDLNRSLANVSALLTDLTGGDLNAAINKVKSNIQTLGPELGKSTGDLAEGFYEVVSSLGFTNDSFGQLEIAARAGAAGLASTKESINFLTATTKTYGDTSEASFKKVADLGFQAVNIGQTTFPELAASIGGVAPVAQAAGVSLEEMFAVIATATGVTGNTSEVTNQLASAITGLLSPSENLKLMYKELGVNSGEAMIAEYGLVGSLQKVAQFSEAAGIPIIELLGRKEAFIITASLAGAQAKTFATNLDRMGQAAKANGAIVTDAFDKQTKGINAAGFEYEQAKVKLEVLSQRLGDQLAPAIVKVLEKVVAMVETFSDLPEPVQKIIIFIGGLAAATGPLLFITGQLLLSWRQIVVFAPKLIAALKGSELAMVGVRLGLIGIISVGIYAFLNGLINKWKEATQAAIDYNLEIAKAEGNALTFARQVAQGPLSSTVSKQEFENRLKEAEILSEAILKANSALEKMKKPQVEKSTLKGIVTTDLPDSAFFNPSKAKVLKQELENLWGVYGKIRTALAGVTVVGEKATDTFNPSPFAGIVSQEQLDALKSLEEMIRSLERQAIGDIKLLDALKQGPEAYRAQQRVNEIDAKLQDARNTLMEQGITLSGKMEARIRASVGAIFDANTETEKFNLLLTAANQIFQASIENVDGLNKGIKALKLEPTEENIQALSIAFIKSEININRMQLALHGLNPESDLAAKLTKQIWTETVALTDALSHNIEAIRRRKDAIAQDSRQSEELIRHEITAIRERSTALLAGPTSLRILERQREIASEVSRLMSDLKPNLGVETIEQFAQRWLELAKEIRAELETEYKIEIAADLKADLVTPLDSLKRYLALIKDLTGEVDKSGEAILKATEAEELRSRAISEHIDFMLGEWSQFFAYLSNAFGGVFEFISDSIRQLEQAKAFGETVKNLAANSGNSTIASYAGALGGVATVFAIYAAIYQGVSDHIKKSKLQRYGNETSLTMVGGDIGVTAIGEGAAEVVRAIKAAIKEFGDALGGIVTDITKLGIRIRNDGKYVAAYVQGVMIGHFASVNDAIQAALREAVIDGQVKIEGISDLVKLGFERAYQFPDFTDLMEFLDKLREISDLTLSPAVIDQIMQVRHFDELWKALEKVAHITEDVIEGMKNLGVAEAQSWQALFDSITGRKRSNAEIRADKERELAIAKAELEIRKSQIAQRILQIKAEILALQSGNALIGGRRGEGGGTGGILGMATAFAVAGEVLAYTTALVAGVVSAETQAMIDLLNAEIAGLEELLKALGELKIPDIGKIGGGGGRDIKQLKEDVLREIALLVAQSKGPLHEAFFNFNQQVAEFVKRAKEAKLSAEDLAKGVNLLTEAFRRGILETARGYAGLETDFSKRLRETQRFFDELEELGRKNTGIPNWLREWMEGQAIGKLGAELSGMIAEFGGLVDPMAAINFKANELRQNVLAFAEAAGWSSEQINEAMKLIDQGIEFQRQQGVNSLLDRLFGYLKEAGLYQQEALEHERHKALMDLQLLEAQFRFYGALDATVKGWLDAAKDFVLGPGFGNREPIPVRVTNKGGWEDIVEKLRTAINAWREGIDQFAESTRELMTDENLTNLTQAQQLEYARSQLEMLIGKAKGGDLEALGKLTGARAEFLRELRESEAGGFGFQKGFEWVMGQTADILSKAQEGEQSLIAKEMAKTVQAWSFVMDQLKDDLVTTLYETTDQLVHAIYDAIGGVPSLASGGIVMRGPRLVRVAEFVPEAIVPLDRLAHAIPYSNGRNGNGKSRSRDRVTEPSFTIRDSLARLTAIELSNERSARALEQVKSDISAMRRKN